jgi:hypothetical protein
MEGGAPWPTGLLEPGSKGTSTTPWGEVQVLPADLHLLQDLGEAWGHVPSLTTAQDLRTDRHGRWLLVEEEDASWDVLVPRFGCGRRASSLAQKHEMAAALEATGAAHLPVGGTVLDGHDALLVYPHATEVGVNEDLLTAFADAGRLLASLGRWSTPCAERRWNDEVAVLEGRLGTSTLWRAPHHPSTVGLPWIRLSLRSRIRTTEGGTCYRLLPPTIDEFLSLKEPRRPGLAHAAALEGEAVEAGCGRDGGGPEAWFHAWSSTVPQAWVARGPMSTYRGGLWIWRYVDVLKWRAAAVAWGDEDLLTSTATWLADVDRLQARLGVLRMWRSLAWVGLGGGITALYAHRLDALTSQGTAGLALASGAIVALGLLRYRSAEPGAF